MNTLKELKDELIEYKNEFQDYTTYDSFDFGFRAHDLECRKVPPLPTHDLYISTVLPLEHKGIRFVLHTGSYWYQGFIYGREGGGAFPPTPHPPNVFQSSYVPPGVNETLSGISGGGGGGGGGQMHVEDFWGGGAHVQWAVFNFEGLQFSRGGGGHKVSPE